MWDHGVEPSCGTMVWNHRGTQKKLFICFFSIVQIIKNPEPRLRIDVSTSGASSGTTWAALFPSYVVYDLEPLVKLSHDPWGEKYKISLPI